MSINLQRILSMFPNAQRYLNDNRVSVFESSQDDRLPGVTSSTTIQIHPNDGCFPDDKTMSYLIDYYMEYADALDIEELIVQFVRYSDNHDNNQQTSMVVLNGEYQIRATASCGQKLTLVFDSYAHAAAMYPLMVTNGTVDLMAPKFIKDTRLLVACSTQPPPDDFEGRSGSQSINQIH